MADLKWYLEFSNEAHMHAFVDAAAEAENASIPPADRWFVTEEPYMEILAERDNLNGTVEELKLALKRSADLLGAVQQEMDGVRERCKNVEDQLEVTVGVRDEYRQMIDKHKKLTRELEIELEDAHKYADHTTQQRDELIRTVHVLTEIIG